MTPELTVVTTGLRFPEGPVWMPDGSIILVYTTNICFGGPDMRTAFVTLSGSGQLVSFPWERPGLRLNWQ